MSEDYKKKLQDYMNGKLSAEESEEIEKEIEKLETYQELLDEKLTTNTEKKPDKQLAKMIVKSKWKARFQTVFTGFLTFLAVWIAGSMVFSIGTSLYYNNKHEKIYDITNAAVQTTMPNMWLGDNVGGGGLLFNYKMDYDVMKTIGGDVKVVGNMDFDFRFMRLSQYEVNIQKENQNYYGFDKPGTKIDITSSDWSILEKLPEGTVAEAYITLKDYFGTDELLKKLEKVKINPVWFAVYTGDEFKYDPYAQDIVGFPYQTLWFEDDWIVDEASEEKTGWFTSIGHSSASAPNIEAYGSGELRDKQFLKALRLLQEHKQVLDKMYMFMKIDSKAKYVKKNGVKIYGLVVTGPTKELLKLKEADWVQSLQVSDTALWNYKYTE